MKRRLLLVSVFLSICGLVLVGSQPVQAEDAEKEARAVFVKMVNASR